MIWTSEEDHTVVDGVHPPIIDDDTYETVQGILANTSIKRTNAEQPYLFSRILKCGKCGGSMNGHTYRKKDGKTYTYYKCANRAKITAQCEGLTIPANRLEEFIIKTLTDLSENTVFLQDKEKMMKMLRDDVSPGKSKVDDDRKRLLSAEKDLLSRRDNLLDALERELVDETDFRERYEKVKLELEENRLLQSRMQTATEDFDVTQAAMKASFEEISSFGLNWENLDIEGRIAKIRSIVKRIKVTEENVDVQLYLDNGASSDVAVLSRTGRDSWLLRAWC